MTWGGNPIARRFLASLIAVYHISILFVFKYLSFVCREIGMASPPDISLPIGISFFTFQLLSYVIDVYRGDVPAQRSPFTLALYISFFPQLIAGPIVRYHTIARELAARRETFSDFALGVERFVLGLGKKMLIANYMAFTADMIFDGSPERSVLTAWLGAVCYTMQIYFDFSGYSDMAIGLGRMFGFHFSENFDHPYTSRSVTEFWRRWHISLSTWFRDYVYIPLGGNRVSAGRRTLNLFAVWLLTGLWHGANWTFVAWGMFYFVLLAAEKRAGVRPDSAPRLPLLARAYTMTAVILAWVLFRSPSITSALSFAAQMFGVGAAGAVDPVFFSLIGGCASVLAAAIVLCTPIYGRVRSDAARGAITLAVFALSVVQVVSASYSPFIYFNF